MIDIIAPLQVRLQALTEVDSCLDADDLPQPGIASASRIESVLDDVFGDNVAPVVVQNDNRPFATYRLVSTGVVEIDGRSLMRHDQYVSTMRHALFSELVSKVDLVNTACESAAGIEITDAAVGYDDVAKEYRVDMEQSLIYTNDPATAITAQAILYEISDQGAPTDHDNLIIQLHTRRVGVLLLTAGDMTALRSAVINSLLGHQLNDDHWPIEYRDGQLVGEFGGVTAWRSIFEIQSQLRQSA